MTLRATPLLVILLACLPALSQATDLLTREFNAHYSLSSGIISFGETERSLRRNSDGSFTFTSTTTPVDALEWLLDGRVHEQSIWKLQQGKILPVSYVFDKIQGSKHRHAELTFDWNARAVVNNVNDKTWRISMPDGTLDKHVYQLAIMDGLNKGQKEFSYKIADGGKIKDFVFSVVGDETVAVPLGTYPSVKLKRVGDKRKTVFWCARELNFFPVKIQQVEKNGDKFLAEITMLNGKTDRQQLLGHQP
jgi:hypothetical protein